MVDASHTTKLGIIVLKKLKPLEQSVTFSYSPEARKAVGEEEPPKGGSRRLAACP